LQAIKHEEVMLELESIRAKRERTAPVCPNCSTQTIKYYQSPLSATLTQNTTDSDPTDNYGKYSSCMKNMESQTILLNNIVDLESISSNEMRMFFEMAKNKSTRTANKEVNTDFDLIRSNITIMRQQQTTTTDKSTTTAHHSHNGTTTTDNKVSFIQLDTVIAIV
jgi:hypothetical protein